MRKAVIPVAGFGTRLLPVTKSVPKELLPVVDIPAIQVIVEECVESGIEEVIFVTGRGKEAIEDHFDYDYKLEKLLEERGMDEKLEKVREISDLIRTIAVRQKKPLGLGHAVYCARDVVGDEPFMVALPDDIITATPPCTQQMVGNYEKYGQGVVAVMRVPEDDAGQYGIVSGESWEEGLYRIRSLIEKPDPDLAPSNLAVIGRYLLPPIVFEYLEEAEPGEDGEIQLTDALGKLARERALVGYEFEGMRHDIGDKFGFLTANISHALRRHDLGPKLRSYLEQELEELDREDEE